MLTNFAIGQSFATSCSHFRAPPIRFRTSSAILRGTSIFLSLVCFRPVFSPLLVFHMGLLARTNVFAHSWPLLSARRSRLRQGELAPCVMYIAYQHRPHFEVKALFGTRVGPATSEECVEVKQAQGIQNRVREVQWRKRYERWLWLRCCTGMESIGMNLWRVFHQLAI